MNNKTKNAGYEYFIDMIKAIACIFIILIHCKFPGKCGDIFQAFARFGVPMFFAISGRFLLPDGIYDKKDIRKVMARKIAALVKTTICLWLFYTIYSLFYFLNAGETFFSWIHEKFNLLEFSRLILFNSGKFIYDYSSVFDHMWFLFALIYVYALVFIFAGVLRKWAPFLVVILTGFLFFGELLQVYYPIRPFDISISTWYIMRNWLFVGVPFTMLGFCISENRDTVSILKSRFAGIILATLGIVSTLVEYHLWAVKEVYFGSFLIVLGLLIIANSVRIDRDNFLSVFGRKLSANVYYIHVFVISFSSLLLDHFYPKIYDYDFYFWIKPLLVIVLTIFISLLMYLFRGITIKRKQ
ncbi:MAG: acyltransferase family protein [Butyrivibrio sp.]|nr:acyltransferase family protein [Butyrivibrio sp.]